MKKHIQFIFLAIVLYLLPFTLESQTLCKYDSLQNICSDNIDLLVGQSIYYPKSTYLWQNLFWKNTKGEIYKRIKSTYYSNGSETKDKFYLILDIIHQEEGNTLLKVQKTDDNKILYINCFFLNNEIKPFFIDGYFRKMLDLYINKNLYFNDNITWDFKSYGCKKVINDYTYVATCKDFFFNDTMSGFEEMLSLDFGESEHKYGRKYIEKYRISESRINIMKDEVIAKAKEKEVAEEKKRISDENRVNRQREILDKIMKKVCNRTFYNIKTIYDINGDYSISKFSASRIKSIEYKEPLSDSISVIVTLITLNNKLYRIDSTIDPVSCKLSCTSDDEDLINCSPFKKYPKVKHWKQIRQSDIIIGMTTEEVKLSIGSPYDQNSTESKYDYFEQWIYDDNKTYLMFRNGILVNITYL